MTDGTMQTDILEIRGLSVTYRTQDATVRALNDVDLTLKEGMALGLVGETGAGKTTFAKGVMRLIPTPPGLVEGGRVLYRGKDIYGASKEEVRQLHGQEIAMIFQDPMTALNPVMTVGEQIAEAVRAHNETISSRQAMRTAEDTLVMVGIPAERSGEYPHQFSGGMKQRVVIAMALACRPKVLIADEPTTALDVTIQAQVLEMMNTLRRQLNMAMLLITHDLGVVAQNCDHVAVIYAGEIMEYGTVFEVFDSMCHPYTIGLFNSLPSLARNVRRLVPIEGLMPDPTALPAGCSFNPRCPFAQDICRTIHPGTRIIGGEHSVRCHFPRVGGA